MASSPTKPPPLSTLLPPLILGTATFNTQYVPDPHRMPANLIVSRALSLGIRAFDTSPYYGPSESILGSALSHALSSPSLPQPIPRTSLFLITKCGRIAPEKFDYSPPQIRYSVLRSLRQLGTGYLDLVYAHDVEFVSDAEVLAAVKELRRLRGEGLVRYVGISGFPVERLVELAEMVERETGEGVDAVLSYGNFTVQNRTLGRAEVLEGKKAEGKEGESWLRRFKEAGVGVVLNASMLGMGLLTSAGIPPDPEVPVVLDGGERKKSPLAKWHPSPPNLRLACKELAELAKQKGERLESVAIRWALAEWARVGAEAGLGMRVGDGGGVDTVGGTVMGVTSVAELEETVREWKGVLAARKEGREKDDDDEAEAEADREMQRRILELVEKEMWPALEKEGWLDYSWASPGEGFVNQLKDEERGIVPQDDGVLAGYEEAKTRAAREWKAAFCC
ncbi:Aldo/keto reductase family-domain-containing protein [Coniochaeta sp. 2T2.1]|nr:Aldo/keto reductase family-domain-containing protein [Coniochaeta sp. 2T2.1]